MAIFKRTLLKHTLNNLIMPIIIVEERNGFAFSRRPQFNTLGHKDRKWDRKNCEKRVAIRGGIRTPTRFRRNGFPPPMSIKKEQHL